MKYENEITVIITCSYTELTNILLSKGFAIIDDLRLVDSYYFNQSIDLINDSNQQILSNYLIIREPSNDNPKITYKYKELNDDNSIRRQGKTECDIYSKEDAEQLLKCLGFKKGFVIDNIIKKYSRGEILFVAALVNNEYICLEYSGIGNQEVEEIIKDFASYGLPYDNSNYYVNKAIIELDKLRKTS